MSLKTVLDIETIPDQRPGAFERYIELVKPPGNYKKQESIDAWLAENAEAVAEQDYCKTALTGLRGEVCSIAYAIDDGEIQSITRGLHNLDNEYELLDLFWSCLKQDLEKHVKHDSGWARPLWIGHNIIDFDLRFLYQRSIINGVKMPWNLPVDARHGGDWVFDTMKAWAGWKGYVKLDELVEAFGIELPIWGDAVSQIDGSNVWELYRNGQFDVIAEYNKLDVWKTREVYKRFLL